MPNDVAGKVGDGFPPFAEKRQVDCFARPNVSFEKDLRSGCGDVDDLPEKGLLAATRAQRTDDGRLKIATGLALSAFG